MDAEWKVTRFMAHLLTGTSWWPGLSSSSTYDASLVDDLGLEIVLWSRQLPPCCTDRTAGKKRFTSTSPDSFSAERRWRTRLIKIVSGAIRHMQPRLDLKFRFPLSDSDSESLFIPPGGNLTTSS